MPGRTTPVESGSKGRIFVSSCSGTVVSLEVVRLERVQPAGVVRLFPGGANLERSALKDTVWTSPKGCHDFRRPPLLTWRSSYAYRIPSPTSVPASPAE